MKIIFISIISLFILNQNLISNNFQNDSANKVYQRTIYKPEVKANTKAIENIKQWDNTEKMTRRVYLTFNYEKRNGNLEANFQDRDGINPPRSLFELPKESISAFSLGSESFEAYRFVDTNQRTNLMYFNSFKFETELAFHTFLSNGFKTQYMDNGFGLSYSRGYGWAYEDNSILSLYKSTGLSLNRYYLENTGLTGIGDYFEEGIRYQPSKNFAVSLAYKENLTHFNLGFENFAMSKILELGGNAALDKFVTPIFINKKYKYAPIYQLLYQSAWSYMVYSLKKKNPYFPFSEKADEFAVPDSRLIIGIKVYISDSFR